VGRCPILDVQRISWKIEVSKMQSLLVHAIHTGNATCARELLLQGADANCESKVDYGKGSQKYLPLHEATGCEDEELVALLIHHGADIFKVASTGATALHDAALCGNYAAAKLLLEQGVEVNIQDKAGRVALHEAAEHGQGAIVRLLLEHHASTTLQANDGKTPTDLALDHEHFPVVLLLLQHGGTFSKRRGYTTAWELAVWTGNVALTDLLTQNKGVAKHTRAKAKSFETILSGLSKLISDSQQPGFRFCSTCKNFQSRPSSSWEGGYAEGMQKREDAHYNHLTLDKVESSAGEGCVLCRMILDSLYDWDPVAGKSTAGTKGDGTLSQGVRSESGPGCLNLDVRLTYNAYSTRYLRASPEHLWSDFRDKIKVECGYKLGFIRVASLDGKLFTSYQFHWVDSLLDDTANLLSQTDRLDDSSTGSVSALAMAGVWLRTCLTQHVRCNQYQKGCSLLPSRVIDVGPPDGSQESFLYSNREHRDLYLTLSHRWGDYDAVKTKLSNLRDRSTSMPMNTLPKVFHDAVVTTRKLGVRFLWIDTLCIVQDDPLDWQLQASNMANIFRNSLMTIAAAADNCYEHGVFRERTSHRKRPCALDLRLSHRQKALFQKPGQLFAFGDRHEAVDAERPIGVLDTRAWILQEQLLSPRVLYFTADELFWDCVSINASESYPTGIPDLVYNSQGHGRSYRHFKEAVTSNKLNITSLSQVEIHKTWRQIVHAYSNRDISVETDRMIATAGIVSLMEKMLNDRCIFGIWAKHLNSEQMWQELLWSVDQKVPKQRVRHMDGGHAVIMRMSRDSKSKKRQPDEADTIPEFESDIEDKTGLISRLSRRTHRFAELGTLPMIESEVEGDVKGSSSFLARSSTNPITKHKTSWTFNRPIEFRAPTWSWYAVMAPIVYKEIDSRDHNSVTCEAHLEGIEEQALQPFTALRLKGRMTRMYPRSGHIISPIPESELNIRINAIQYANKNRTGLEKSASDPTAEWEPDICDVYSSTHDIWCFEIARANIYQLCLCLVPLSPLKRPDHLPDHLKLVPLYERVGICSWNMYRHNELPCNSPIQILIV
jgi:hypothetical protein